MTSTTIYLTNKCNLRCKHCFVGHDQTSNREQSSTQAVKAMLSNIAANGITAVTLLGGEVLSFRSDIVEILEFCEIIGLCVSINTNLTIHDKLEAILECKALSNIVVSLDGATNISHDKIRGRGSFEKTMAGLELLKNNDRIIDKSILIDLTFVLSSVNKESVYELIKIYKRFNINKLNFMTVAINDRAETNASLLKLDEKELLNVCASFYIFCFLERGILLDMYIPPAFGLYLDKILHAPARLWNYNGCGGTNVYSYVDLYGNNLPCPAMSFEENKNTSNNKIVSSLNLIENSMAAIHQKSLFKGFNLSVKKKSRNALMDPCNKCRFQTECSPCTNEIIRGKVRGTVDICSAIYKYGNDRIPGIVENIFGKYPPAKPPSLLR